MYRNCGFLKAPPYLAPVVSKFDLRAGAIGSGNLVVRRLQNNVGEPELVTRKNVVRVVEHIPIEVENLIRAAGSAYLTLSNGPKCFAGRDDMDAAITSIVVRAEQWSLCLYRGFVSTKWFRSIRP